MENTLGLTRILFAALVGGLLGTVAGATILLRYLAYRTTEKRSSWPTVFVSLACLVALALFVLEPRLRADTSLPALLGAFIGSALLLLLAAYGAYRRPTDAGARKLPMLDYSYQARGEINQAHLEEGLKLAQRAIASFPREADGYIEAGRALKRLGELRQALQVVEDGLKARPGDPRLLYNRACYRVLLQEPVPSALRDLEEAFKSMPKLKESARVDTDLEGLRNLEAFRNLVGSGQG